MPHVMRRRRGRDARHAARAWLARAWPPVDVRAARRLRAALFAALVIAPPVSPLAAAPAGEAAAGEHVGPYAASDFIVTTGRASAIQPAAAWYFADEYIATPRAELAVTSITPGMRAIDDVTRAARAHVAPGWPPMVWVGSTQILRDARMAADGGTIEAGGATLRLALVPKLALNRSWFDASSARFAAARPLTLRGERAGDAFVLRALWPQDFAVDATLAPSPLPAAATPQLAIRALMRATPDGGAREPFAATLVHRRDGAPPTFDGKPVLVVIVNGAQGDDDEAHGGHFAIGTGVIGAGGAIGDILINNFYSLDLVSEKGILAAPTPLDRYLGDLNSGQGWYRPSFLAVVVLDDAQVTRDVQDAFNRMYVQFWRHQLVYQHATMNCTGISVDTLRALGLPVPARGAASRVEAWLGIPYALVKFRSLARARFTYEYLTEDVTRLLPAAAFEDTLAVLLRLAREGARDGDGALARRLATDIVAIEVLRIPQWPSSRRFGSWPVVTPDEYFARLPRDAADIETVPVPPREFPAALRDADLLPPPARRSDVPLFAFAGLVAIVAGYALRVIRRLL